MPQVIKINHPLKRYEKQLISIESGMTLAEIRGMPEITNTLKADVDIAISLNGEIIPFEKWCDRKVKEDDFVLLVPWAAKGSDEKSILNIVIMVAVMFAAPGLLGAGGLGLTGITYAAAYVGVMVGTSMIVSSLTPRPSPPSLAFDESELSQSFGWNPATIQRQGLPRPRWYGLNKMYGNVSQAWTEITGATTNIQRLYALIDLGIGPFRETVVESSLKLNSQEIANLDNIEYEVRKGLLRQNYISYFEKTKVEFATAGLPILIKNGSPKIYELKNADYDDIEIDLAFPRGLYDATGSPISNHTVNITIEVKKTIDTAWTKIADGVNIVDDTTNKVIRSYTTSGIIAIDRGSKYQIRVTKNTTEKDSVQWGDDLFLDRIREVTDEQFTYPRAALVGIRALATDQLSGAIGFSCLSRGLYMVDYTDSAQPIIYSTNPGLILADILTQPVYSGKPSTWGDLKLLLNFNGVDGATSTIDESEKGHTVNFTATAELDTAEKEFGTASLILDGDSDDVNITNDNDSFNILENIVDDWTIDFFAKFADHVGIEYLLAQYESNDNRWYLYNLHGTGLVFNTRVGGDVKINMAGTEISDTDQHHIAICKVGANIGLYVDGVQIAHDLMVAGDAGVYNGDLFIGQHGNDSDWFDGHIDHLRIIKSNIFNATPNDPPNDTITVPTEEFTNPFDSFVVERYDGYDPSELDLPAFEELVEWCNDAYVNPVNYGIVSISQVVHAVVVTTSKHNRKVGDIVLFRGVPTAGMIELVDEATAEILAVVNDTTFVIDLDTSGYSAYTGAEPKLLVHFDGVKDSTDFTDAIETHTITTIANAKVSDTKKFGTGSGVFNLDLDDGDGLSIPDHADWDIVGNNADNWTIDFFVNHVVDSFEWNQTYLSQGEDGDNYWTFYVTSNTLRRVIFVMVSGGVLKISTGTINFVIGDSGWQHIALCKVANEYAIYVDGIQRSYSQDDDTDTFEALLHIGTSYLDGSYYNGLHGRMDELCIVDSNRFNASPNSGKTDTIVVPTAPTVVGLGTVEELKTRFDFNGGFDTETTMWDAALKVCEICRCVPYFKGSKISVAIDKAGDAVFAYTSGNIIKDSFRQIFIPTNERASQIEVHYRDKNQDYQRQPFTLINPNVGNPTAKARLDLFGITDEELAGRIASNMLLKNQHIKTICRFSADIDSIASEIGDPILAPIDATKYGQVGDGRILSASNTGDAIITVSGIFTWDDPDWESPGLIAYRLMVKTADDAIETKSIIDITESSDGTETDITVDGTFSILPVVGDLWAAGKEDYEIKKYRTINLRQSDKQRVEVTAIEYVDAIYADD